VKTVISFITFNCLKYTKLCLKSLKCSFPHEILVIDNGSTDGTVEWLKTQNVTLIENGKNLGVSYCFNTMYDYAWKDNPDNYLLVVSNDNVLLPSALDNLIKSADIAESSVLSGDAISSPIYLARYAEDRKFFSGGVKINLKMDEYHTVFITDWSHGTMYNLIEETADEFVDIMCKNLTDVLAMYPTISYNWGFFVPGHRLYKKAYFDALGYWDANFYPVYSTDFDYATRARLLNQPCDLVFSSLSFEFWSRCLYEGVAPVKDIRRDDYYRDKWGITAHDVEDWTVPFNGNVPVKYAGYDTSKLKIDSREGELDRVRQLMGDVL